MAPSGSSEKGTLEIGFDIIDEAEVLVNMGDLAKAIFKLQQAMDQFGKIKDLPPGKKRKIIDMISARQAEVSKLKEYLKDHPEEQEKYLGTPGCEPEDAGTDQDSSSSSSDSGVPSTSSPSPMRCPEPEQYIPSTPEEAEDLGKQALAMIEKPQWDFKLANNRNVAFSTYRRNTFNREFVSKN